MHILIQGGRVVLFLKSIFLQRWAEIGRFWFGARQKCANENVFEWSGHTMVSAARCSTRLVFSSLFCFCFPYFTDFCSISGSTDYSTHIDMWGVGCILYEMAKMRPLFTSVSRDEQLNFIFRSVLIYLVKIGITVVVAGPWESRNPICTRPFVRRPTIRISRCWGEKFDFVGGRLGLGYCRRRTRAKNWAVGYALPYGRSLFCKNGHEDTLRSDNGLLYLYIFIRIP